MMSIHDYSFLDRPLDAEARDHVNKIDFFLARMRAADATKARAQQLAPRLAAAAAAAEAWLDGARLSDARGEERDGNQPAH